MSDDDRPLFWSPDDRPDDRPGWRRRTVLGALVALPVAGVGAAISRALGSTRSASAAAADTTATAAPAATTVATAIATTTSTAGPPPAAPMRTIAEENALPGTTDWQVPQVPAVWDKIRGYASRSSIAPGEPVQLFVTTNAPTYWVTAFRMGHYGGAGGRRVWTSGPLAGQVQPAPRTDRATNARDAPWYPSVQLLPDADWRPGSYLLKLQSDDGGQSHIPLVIRDDDNPSAVHLQHDVTTWQAYNRWGGASLYEGERGRSTVVSFDRPYDFSGGGNFLGGVFEVTALVESLGLDVTYSTSLDTHARPDLVGRHKVWISPAHDEYWSLEMRNGVEAARDAGVNLMFLGANCMYRRIRLNDTMVGPNRLVVNYRSASKDPYSRIDPQRVTTSWREAPAARPESSIVGTYYESNPVRADMIIADADAWMFQGTGVKNGDRWTDVIGNEYDRVTLEVPTPPTIQVLAHSPVLIKGRWSYSDMTYYTAPSGAGVFSAGSTWFERHLLPGQSGTDAQMAAMMSNLLDAFAAGPAGIAHPAQPNLERLGIRRGYLPRLP